MWARRLGTDGPRSSRAKGYPHRSREEQEYKSEEGDEDGVYLKVDEEDDGIKSLGGCRTHLYIGDNEDGICQVKKEDKGLEL